MRRLRSLLLREWQVMAALEAHRAVLPSDLRDRYASLVRESERRIRALEQALSLRGDKVGTRWISLVRGVGRLAGRLSSWGSLRRILSMDIDTVRGLERSYFQAFHETPPRDVACMLAEFVGELETERSGLVEQAQAFFAED